MKSQYHVEISVKTVRGISDQISQRISLETQY